MSLIGPDKLKLETKRVEFRTRIVLQQALEKQRVYSLTRKKLFNLSIDENTSFVSCGPGGNINMNKYNISFVRWFGRKFIARSKNCSCKALQWTNELVFVVRDATIAFCDLSCIE